MRHLLTLILMAILSVLAIFAQAPPNFRIYPGQVAQTEPVVAVSPVDPLLLFASAVTLNTSNGFKSEGVYVSSDGGQNWSGSDTCTGELLVNHGGDPGVAITPDGRLILTHIGLVFSGMYSHFSTNLGASWSSAYTITSGQPEDKGTIAMDSDPASPFYGRLYAAWVNFVQPFPVLAAYSTNSGENWTAPAPINSPPPARSSGGSVAIGPAGRVYVAWSGVTSAAPFIEDFAGFASSADGGTTWSVSQNIFDMNGISGTLSSKSNIRVNGLPQVVADNSGGPRDGWIYIVTTQRNLAPAGSDPDIILHRSSDGGLNWSAGIRVNQDAFNNGKIQYFPAMDVDAGGGVNILFYDDRNTAPDSAEVFLARSNDGGDSWSEQVISDHRFQPKPVIGGSSNYQGDHIALLAVGDKLYALWMDDSSGLYQVWLAIIPIQPNAVEIPGGGLPSTVELFQNYPNPFNPATNLGFQISDFGLVKLEVYDLTGRRVATLVDEHLPPGQYRAHWNAAGQPSGIYFYRLQAGGIMKYRKMVLLR